MQSRRDLPGRIIFTIGVAMSSTCVALILILWVGGRQSDDFSEGGLHRELAQIGVRSDSSIHSSTTAQRPGRSCAA